MSVKFIYNNFASQRKKCSFLRKKEESEDCNDLSSCLFCIFGEELFVYFFYLKKKKRKKRGKNKTHCFPRFVQLTVPITALSYFIVLICDGKVYGKREG